MIDVQCDWGSKFEADIPGVDSAEFVCRFYDTLLVNARKGDGDDARRSAWVGILADTDGFFHHVSKAKWTEVKGGYQVRMGIHVYESKRGKWEIVAHMDGTFARFGK